MRSVLFTEPATIKDACERVLGDGRRLSVTFITHTQAHHLRIFPTHETGADGSGNVPPGVHFDTGLVRPKAHDFYLMGWVG